MNDMEEKFHQYKQHAPVMELGHSFEERVFAKIKRKKKQRQMMTSVTIGVLLLGLLFVAQATLFPPEPVQPTLAKTTLVPIPEKEEVPVVEDVVFASSDNRSAYIIEQVGYKPQNNTL